MAASALLVAVPEVEDVVGGFRELHDPSAVRGLPAHVTVLYPFVAPATIDEDLIERVRGVFAGVDRFVATFDRLSRFPGPVLYLAPTSAAPFIEPTERVHRAFPEHLPYNGIYDDVVPHLTVVDGGSVDLLENVESQVSPRLPVSSSVASVWLMSGDSRPHSWRVRARFDLGG